MIILYLIVPFAVAGDKMEMEYIVKIDGVEIKSGGAGNLLRYVQKHGGTLVDANGNEIVKFRESMELTSKNSPINLGELIRICKSPEKYLDYVVELDPKAVGAGCCLITSNKNAVGICINKTENDGREFVSNFFAV